MFKCKICDKFKPIHDFQKIQSIIKSKYIKIWKKPFSPLCKFLPTVLDNYSGHQCLINPESGSNLKISNIPIIINKSLSYLREPGNKTISHWMLPMEWSDLCSSYFCVYWRCVSVKQVIWMRLSDIKTKKSRLKFLLSRPMVIDAGKRGIQSKWKTALVELILFLCFLITFVCNLLCKK